MFDIIIQIMKKNSSKTQLASTIQRKAFKSEASTGTNSRQRSHIQSLVVPKQLKQHASTLQSKQELSNLKTQQLYSIIQTFYSTLCDLPLQKLISTGEPQAWIAEQQQTMYSLEEKLRKLSKDKNQEYYKWKLKSVATILGNISENMAMLRRMNELRNYCSGTESSSNQSRCKSSLDRSSKNIKLGQFASEDTNIKQMLNYDEYFIEDHHQSRKVGVSNREIMAQTVNSEIESSDEENCISKSEVFTKRNPKRVMTKQTENMNHFNKMNIQNGINQNPSMKNDLKDKTLTKVQLPKPCKSQTTIYNISTDNRGFNLSHQQTKRTEGVMQESSSFKHQPSEGEFVQMIKEMRIQLMEKDKQIERLLMNEQQFDQTIEFFQEREKTTKTQMLFLKENVKNIQREKQNLMNEIRRFQSQSEDLRQTIRLQRQRTKKQQKERDRIQEKLYEQSQSKDQLLSEIQRLKQQNKQVRKSERQMKEKLQVYTRKYFQLFGSAQSMKQQLSQISEQLLRERMKNKSESNYENIRKVIQVHKSRLCSQQL